MVILGHFCVDSFENAAGIFDDNEIHARDSNNLSKSFSFLKLLKNGWSCIA